ncbi:MAG: MBL fold metallo-hydrolase [Candidatus Goldiibacteriota bacterium]
MAADNQKTGKEQILEWIDKHVVRYGQSAFKITGSGGEVIYIDAFKDFKDAPKADYYFATHNHGDHFNPALALKLKKESTHIIVPAFVKQSGSDKGVATDTMAAGESKKIGSLEVMAMPAYNPKKIMHPKSKGYIGYIIKIDNYRIYHAGDTDFIPEMKGLRPDIAMLPVGGGPTMGWKEAVEAADAIEPGVVIPIHYGMLPFTKNAGINFSKNWNGVTKLL